MPIGFRRRSRRGSDVLWSGIDRGRHGRRVEVATACARSEVGDHAEHGQRRVNGAVGRGHADRVRRGGCAADGQTECAVGSRNQAEVGVDGVEVQRAAAVDGHGRLRRELGAEVLGRDGIAKRKDKGPHIDDPISGRAGRDAVPTVGGDTDWPAARR